ncbi:hypothetical protein [Streptantibioticus ferralitis]|uniref:Integral membrane protein n=1 Tax=Streptantibioticus ferralitis TaxID=236510 RepID=A0ABT5YSJ3_9ACTN|nr:hypothetical protein [Streptantibioticus ferralitis]MDF2254575.1 hypothetical protein [Streptantibioticus ferralitis]
MSRKHETAPEAVPLAAPRIPRLTAAAALAGLEGLALAAGGVYLVAMGLFGHRGSTQTAVMGGLTVLAMAALPLTAAYGLLRARRWSRGPALIIQLIALPIAWTMGQNGGALLAAAVAIGAAALAELVLLVHPAATAALGADAGRDGD